MLQDEDVDRADAEHGERAARQSVGQLPPRRQPLELGHCQRVDVAIPCEIRNRRKSRQSAIAEQPDINWFLEPKRGGEDSYNLDWLVGNMNRAADHVRGASVSTLPQLFTDHGLCRPGCFVVCWQEGTSGDRLHTEIGALMAGCGS